MANYENTYYEKYQKEYFKKYGTDFGFDYVGSAFHTKPKEQKLSAKELRSMMPMNDLPVKIDHMDFIEDHCDKCMRNAAANSRKYFHEYRIRDIYPGLPPFDTPEKKQAALKDLYRRVSKWEGVKCYAHPEKEDVLVISWAHEFKPHNNN